ncbi:hypothetical protein Zmor_011373 [Zophobas morio]|uniref:Uncharacterized protein n=1 Tax=Zophobas morio TaxID=2755281 RepID=A0AA38IV18_9CUCU|nr:hypothetical protein Zmor_011373 [Zophobas morio]
MTESYFRNGVAIEGEWHYNSGAVLQEFQQKCPDFNFIVADFSNVVRNTVRVFPETDRHKKGTGRPTLCTNEVIEDVEERMENNPSTSLRHLSQEVELSGATCHEIVKKKLQLFPYNLHAYHELLPADFNRRIAYRILMMITSWI